MGDPSSPDGDGNDSGFDLTLNFSNTGNDDGDSVLDEPSGNDDVPETDIFNAQLQITLQSSTVYVDEFVGHFVRSLCNQRVNGQFVKPVADEHIAIDTDQSGKPRIVIMIHTAATEKALRSIITRTGMSFVGHEYHVQGMRDALQEIRFVLSHGNAP